MSNYTKTVDFAAKDNLNTGNPSKVVKGTEINTEFDNIETALNSKTESQIPSGTKMLFVETGAPTGWTLNNDYDDKTILIRTSGNITDDDLPDTAGNFTISNTELTLNSTLPNHGHNHNIAIGNTTGAQEDGGAGTNVPVYAHSHNVTGNVGNPATNPAINITKGGTLTTGNWRPAHVEAIVCSKD